VRVVRKKTHGNGPVDLGTVDSCFLMVDEHQQVRSRPTWHRALDNRPEMGASKPASEVLSYHR
jgi:hypothetical protein